MRDRCFLCFLPLMAMVGLAVLSHGRADADDTMLLSIGPRIGFTGKSPFLGKEQKYAFHLTDIAATFKLPWSWPLGQSPWTVETRLITSAGVLTAAGDTGFMGTVIPGLALSGWNRFISLDAGLGAAFFSRSHYGTQDFGGRAQIAGTVGIQINPISCAFAGFRLQHFSDAGLYGSASLGVDMYIVEVGYRF
jgi:lipid A 3-O-deacylase PagL